MKHTTGFSKLFKNTEYSKAWETRRQLELRKEYENTDIGKSGTEIKSNSTSITAYSSTYQSHSFFIDGLVGYGRISNSLIRIEEANKEGVIMIKVKEDFVMPKSKPKKAKGGLMSIPVRTNSEGIKELDMRKSGGFVPIGVKEKADDVPAMLSKNEFVMTADAVRGAGDGNIKKGAQRMYDLMKRNEGKVA